MNAGDTQIPYDAQCPHGNYYSDCQVCSGAQADWLERIWMQVQDEIDEEAKHPQPLSQS